MQVLVLTKGDARTASSRVRVWQMFERLEKEGIQSTILPSFAHAWWSLSPKRFRSLARLYKALRQKPDVLFMHKSLFPWDVVMIVLFWARLTKTPLVYDLDDAEWIHSRKKTQMLMKRANTVFAGSQVIYDYTFKHNAHVVLVPSAVDHELYKEITHDSNPPVIVWVGHGPAHLKSGNFDILRDAFRILAEEKEQFQFVLVGGKQNKALHEFWGNEPYAVRIIDEAEWGSAETVPSLLRELRPRIGVMPLTDSPFVRAKCAYKAIEYMAAGIPVVASPVGEIVSMIETSRAGVLASTKDEWAREIKNMLDDQKSSEMGEVGKVLIREKYSYDAVVPLITQELSKIKK